MLSSSRQKRADDSLAESPKRTRVAAASPDVVCDVVAVQDRVCPRCTFKNSKGALTCAVCELSISCGGPVVCSIPVNPVVCVDDDDDNPEIIELN